MELGRAVPAVSFPTKTQLLRDSMTVHDLLSGTCFACLVWQKVLLIDELDKRDEERKQRRPWRTAQRLLGLAFMVLWCGGGAIFLILSGACSQ